MTHDALPPRPTAPFTIPLTLEGMDAQARAAATHQALAASKMLGPLQLLDRLCGLNEKLAPLPEWERVRVVTDFDSDVEVHVILADDRGTVEICNGDSTEMVMEKLQEEDIALDPSLVATLVDASFSLLTMPTPASKCVDDFQELSEEGLTREELARPARLLLFAYRDDIATFEDALAAQQRASALDGALPAPPARTPKPRV